ncbi:gp21 [Lomovskayavirus C31]|uniref:Gp21 n=1 Tax=Streptomyces phage phiC31 TaxID=10719 RepID=Q9ZX87_BPPHC|nr:gp21 [Lomovskayavirus C31]CAA07145.1 gp21 [Lomovskayavirus C31]
MIANFWEDASAVIRRAPLEDESALMWLAGPTLPDGSAGEMVSMTLETARKLRDRLNAQLAGFEPTPTEPRCTRHGSECDRDPKKAHIFKR